MNFKKLGKCFCIIMLAIYFMGPIIRDVIPNYIFYDYEDWLALAGMYTVGLIAAFPLALPLVKPRRYWNRASGGLCCIALLGILLQILCAIYFWANGVIMYLSMSIVICLAGVAAIYMGKKSCKHSHGAAISSVNRLHSNLYDKREPASSFLLKPLGYNAGVLGNVPGSNSALTQPLSTTFVDDAINSDFSPEMNIDTSINPTTGLPMIGGISGLDVGGNIWGASHFDDSTTYDTNREY